MKLKYIANVLNVIIVFTQKLSELLIQGSYFTLRLLYTVISNSPWSLIFGSLWCRWWCDTQIIVLLLSQMEWWWWVPHPSRVYINRIIRKLLFSPFGKARPDRAGYRSHQSNLRRSQSAASCNHFHGAVTPRGVTSPFAEARKGLDPRSLECDLRTISNFVR